MGPSSDVSRKVRVARAAHAVAARSAGRPAAADVAMRRHRVRRCRSGLLIGGGRPPRWPTLLNRVSKLVRASSFLACGRVNPLPDTMCGRRRASAPTAAAERDAMPQCGPDVAEVSTETRLHVRTRRRIEAADLSEQARHGRSARVTRARRCVSPGQRRFCRQSSAPHHSPRRAAAVGMDRSSGVNRRACWRPADHFHCFTTTHARRRHPRSRYDRWRAAASMVGAVRPGPRRRRRQARQTAAGMATQLVLHKPRNKACDP